ncbi:MAG TPA: hypothetical protein VHX61_07420 [Rhizomicrobium sp.]|jgi:hypothetical protein|nr:hypothetical protein [Rhizomicrobium sp.]
MLRAIERTAQPGERERETVPRIAAQKGEHGSTGAAFAYGVGRLGELRG